MAIVIKIRKCNYSNSFTKFFKLLLQSFTEKITQRLMRRNAVFKDEASHCVSVLVGGNEIFLDEESRNVHVQTFIYLY